MISPGADLTFCVPTGNFGNILAGWYARQMGLPVRRFVCASNANDVLTRFLATGVYDRNRPLHKTASPSMDILISSNLERLLSHLAGEEEAGRYMALLAEHGRYEVPPELLERIRREFWGGCADDARAGQYIRRLFEEKDYLMDTHTAVAWAVLEQYRAETGEGCPAVVVSTASPFKFCNSVLKALGHETDRPGTELIRLLERETGKTAPAPLAELAGRAVRFSDATEKSGMRRRVETFLS